MQKVVFIQLVAGLLIGGSLGALMGYFGKCTTGACPLTANPWRGAFFGALIGGLFAFSAGGSSQSVPVPASPKAESSVESSAATPRYINGVEDFDRYVLKASQPVLVDFYADWCGPCRMLAPTLEKLAKEYDGRAVVGKVNVDHLSQVAGRYGIQSIPAVLFFQNGKEMERLIGVQSQDKYAGVLNGLLNQ